MQLVSCGVRHTLWLQHYSARLYLRQGVGPNAVGNPGEAKTVHLQVINTCFLPKQIPGKWRRPLQRALTPESLAKLDDAYRSLAPGDQVVIRYALPKGVEWRGVELRINGTVLVRNAGHGVIDALLAEWAGDTPVDDKLARLVRNHPCRDNPVAQGEARPR